LPEFIRSRMRPVINVGYPSQEEICDIVSKRFPTVSDHLRPLLERFWELWPKLDRKAPTPRDAIYVFNLALSLAAFGDLNKDDRYSKSTPEKPFPLKPTGRLMAIAPEHLEIAFQELFHEGSCSKS